MFIPNYFYFVFCCRPAARSKRRCIPDLCFSWLTAGLLACCVDLLAIPPVVEIDCVCVRTAPKKQFSLCTLDNVGAQLYMPKPHIWDWIKSANFNNGLMLCWLCVLLSIHSNTTSLYCMVLCKGSCCSTQIFVVNYSWCSSYSTVITEKPLLKGENNREKGHEKTLNLCWLSIFLFCFLLMTLCPATAACLWFYQAIDELILWCSDA